MKKNAPLYSNVASYIDAQPERWRTALLQIHQIIREVAPKAEETISYGMPAFHYHGPLVYFGAFKNHVSFFPGSASVIETFKTGLAQYKISKGSIQFTTDQPIPSKILKKIVTLRMKQNEEKSMLKKKKNK